MILIPFFILYRIIIVLVISCLVCVFLPYVMTYLLKCFLNWVRDIENDKAQLVALNGLLSSVLFVGYLTSAKEFILNKKTS